MKDAPPYLKMLKRYHEFGSRIEGVDKPANRTRGFGDDYEMFENFKSVHRPGDKVLFFMGAYHAQKSASFDGIMGIPDPKNRR